MLHDRAAPHRHTLFSVIPAEQELLSDKELQALNLKINDTRLFWTDSDESQDSELLLKHATKYYGGPEQVVPYHAVKDVITFLESVANCVDDILADRRKLYSE